MEARRASAVASEDLVQESLAKVGARWPKLREGHSPERYVRTTLASACGRRWVNCPRSSEPFWCFAITRATTRRRSLTWSQDRITVDPKLDDGVAADSVIGFIDATHVVVHPYGSESGNSIRMQVVDLPGRVVGAEYDDGLSGQTYVSRRCSPARSVAARHSSCLGSRTPPGW